MQTGFKQWKSRKRQEFYNRKIKSDFKLQPQMHRRGELRSCRYPTFNPFIQLSRSLQPERVETILMSACKVVSL